MPEDGQHALLSTDTAASLVVRQSERGDPRSVTNQAGLGNREQDAPDEVEHESVDDLVRQSVLLVQQDADEERVGTSIVHLGQVRDGRSRVDHGHRGLGQDRREDGSLFEGAVRLRRSRDEGMERLVSD